VGDGWREFSGTWTASGRRQVIPLGGERRAAIADFYSFSKSKGAFAGMSLSGSVIDVRSGLNKAYYGKEATPVDILVKRSVSNKGADVLRGELQKTK
jgi:lipid-binding SYLF domain-containing protein